jgi:hypothetical protein
MQRPTDAIKQFTASRAHLVSERHRLQQRLQKIEEVLGYGENVGSLAGSRLAFRTGANTVRTAKRSRPRNALNIREAVGKVTANKPLGLNEIVEAVQKIGYKFATQNPANSVGVFLYGTEGRKHFKRVNKKFSPK